MKHFLNSGEKLLKAARAVTKEFPQHLSEHVLEDAGNYYEEICEYCQLQWLSETNLNECKR
jgi:hypothetical protein